MKQLLFLALVIVLVSSIGMAQVDPFRSSSGVPFNQTSQVYYKSGYSASTANDTTNFISILGTSDFALFGSADDSVQALLYYQLRNTALGVNGSWTFSDTLGADGLGSAVVATGATQLLAQVALSTVNGYDAVRFYVDYISGCTTGIDGSAAVAKFYIHRKPN